MSDKVDRILGPDGKMPDDIKGYFISDLDFEAFLDMAQGYVKSCEGGTEVMPHISIAFRNKDDLTKLQQGIVGLAIGDEWNDYGVRVNTLRGLASKFLADDNTPMAVAMVSEAWASIVPEEDMDKPRVMPSKDPNRKEVAIVSAMTIDGRSVASMAQITRDEDKNMTFGEWETAEAGESILNNFFHQLSVELRHKHGLDPDNKPETKSDDK